MARRIAGERVRLYAKQAQAVADAGMAVSARLLAGASAHFYRCQKDAGFQSKGGTARAAKLTREERTAIARKGAAARWKDNRKENVKP